MRHQQGHRQLYRTLPQDWQEKCLLEVERDIVNRIYKSLQQRAVSYQVIQDPNQSLPDHKG